MLPSTSECLPRTSSIQSQISNREFCQFAPNQSKCQNEGKAEDFPLYIRTVEPGKVSEICEGKQGTPNHECDNFFSARGLASLQVCSLIRISYKFYVSLPTPQVTHIEGFERNRDSSTISIVFGTRSGSVSTTIWRPRFVSGYTRLNQALVGPKHRDTS